MATFTVKFVKPEHRFLWADYNSDHPSSEAEKVGKDGSLGLTEVIAAKSEAFARAQFEATHPDYMIMEIDKQRDR